MTFCALITHTVFVKDYASINKKWWNNVTPIHARSELYNLEAFKKGKTSLEKTELSELKDVKGKTMLHLMCHFGMDSLSWARQGAIVTGVDISEESIKLAKKLSREVKVPAKFIMSDIYDLPQTLDEKFDIVYTSYGVLCWVKNLKKWAKLIGNYLKPGGTFYIIELHPFAGILSTDFKLEYKYFQHGPFIDDSSGTYTDWGEDVKGLTYEWFYPLGEVVTELINVGLRIEFLHEFPYSMYDQFPGFMEKNKRGEWVLKNKKLQIPLLFSLKATK